MAMAAERGGGCPTSKIRQTQLVEWLLAQVVGEDAVVRRNIGLEPFYAAELPGQPERATYEIARGDLKALKRLDLVEFQQALGGLRSLFVQVTPRARD